MATTQTVFQQLKPFCVRLNASIIQLQSGRVIGKAVIDSLEDLLKALHETQKSQGLTNPAVAEFIFFPISGVFKERAKVPTQALELATKATLVLLETGWRSSIGPDLGIQLLILTTFLAGSNTKSNPKSASARSDELSESSYKCIAATFTSLSQSAESVAGLLDTKNVPAIGHAVSVILDGALDSEAANTQLAALSAFKAFLHCVTDRQVIASILPGAVSILSKILTPSTQSRRSYKVLIQSLDVLQTLLKLALADDKALKEAERLKTLGQGDKELGESWIKASAGQIKVALSNVVRQRDHDRREVRKSLQSLCLAVVEDCATTLVDSQATMLDTLVVLAQSYDDEICRAELGSLVISRSDVKTSLQSSLYTWIMSLPRIMSSNDEAKKRRLVDRVTLTFDLLSDADVPMTIIDEHLSRNLRDSVIKAITLPPKAKGLLTSVTTAEVPNTLLKLERGSEDGFPQILTHRSQQIETLQYLDRLVERLSSHSNALEIAQGYLDQSQVAEGDEKIVTLWLSLHILQFSAKKDETVNELVSFDDTSDQMLEIREELYSHAITILSNIDDFDTSNWKVQALAIEALEFQASQLKEDFKPELVDALYPIVHLMGSSNASLREHSITCLNRVALSCGYSDVQALIVSNVDYLVNAVATKINSFDISPQAPQVIVMMIKLTGPRLIPYLEDLIDNIFDALECFHGYALVVEQLFAVLNAVVQEGVKSAHFATSLPIEPPPREDPQPPLTLESLLAQLRARASRAEATASTPLATLSSLSDSLPDATPHMPWKDLRPSDDEPSEPPAPEPEEKKPELSKTYTTIKRIAELTQHHLPNASPSIRASLLNLLSTALPYLAAHDDAFLPLINLLWPVLTPRLADREVYVVAGVLDVMAAMCAGARDFMSSRVRGVWPAVRKIHARSMQEAAGLAASKEVQRKGIRADAELVTLSAADSALVRRSEEPSALREVGARSERDEYVATTAVQLRRALVRFVVRVLEDTRVSPAMFGEALHVILRGELLEGREDVRAALERRNADAVWLVLERARGQELGEDWVAEWEDRMPAADTRTMVNLQWARVY